MGPLLQDPKQSSIRIVLNPERMVINESQRLYTYLEPLRLPRGRGGRQPRAAAGGALALLRQVVRHPGRPPRGGAQDLRSPALLRGAPLRPRDGRPAAAGASSPRDVFGDRDPTAGLLPREADRGEEGEGRATRSTSACPSRRRTRSRSGRRATSWSSRSIISGATSCCRARWPRGGCSARPSPTSGCGWRSATRRSMPRGEKAGAASDARLLPGLGDARGGGPRPRRRRAQLRRQLLEG